MNNKVISLTKVFLKNSFKTMRRQSNKPSTPSKKVGMTILYAFFAIYIAAIIGFMSYNLISSLVAINQEQVFIGIFFLAITFLLIFQTIFSSLNVLYFSKDLEYVLPLPLKPFEILMAKFNVILITEYIVEMIIGIIPLTIYGILTGAGVLYYIMSLILLILFPILPLLIVCFLIMIIMSFAKITKNRDKFQLFAGIIVVVLAIAIQFVTAGINEEMTNEQVAMQIVQANGLVELVFKYFITLNPTIHAITATSVITGIIEVFKVLLLTSFSYITFLAIGQKLYLKGAIGNMAGGKTSKKQKIGNKSYKNNKVIVSYVKKEFKILFRNPIFFMQCVLPAILMPVIFIFISITGATKESNAEGIDLIQILNGVSPVWIVVGILMATQFLSMMIYVSPTAISRDGRNAAFIKYIPVSLHRQFVYKAIPNYIITQITILITLIIAWILAKVSPMLLVPVYIIASIISIVQSYLMEIVDLKKPKLEWDTEYAVVKQNLNLIWTAVFGMVSIGVLAVLGGLMAWMRLDIRLCICIFIILYSIVAYLVDRFVNKNQDTLFEKVI